MGVLIIADVTVNRPVVSSTVPDADIRPAYKNLGCFKSSCSCKFELLFFKFCNSVAVMKLVSAVFV